MVSPNKLRSTAIIIVLLMNYLAAFSQTTITLVPYDSKCIGSNSNNWNDNRFRAYQWNGSPIKVNGFLKFDISAIPDNACVTSMVLRTFHEQGFGNPSNSPEPRMYRCADDSWSRMNASDPWPGMNQVLCPIDFGPFPSANLVPWDWVLDESVIPWATDLADNTLTICTQNEKSTYSYVYWYGHNASPAPPELTITYNSCVLPVHYADFAAVRLNENLVKTSWVIQAEANYTEMELQRMLENEHSFSTMAAWPAAGSRQQKETLSWNDRNSYAGEALYRLKFTEADGSASYSEIRTVGRINDSFFSSFAYANDAGQAELLLESGAEKDLIISLIDISGQVLETRPYHTAAGKSRFTFQQRPANGIYIIRIEDESGSLLKWHKLALSDQ